MTLGESNAKHSHVSHIFPKSISVLLLLDYGGAIAQTQQEHVHNMSHSVMPFDVAKIVHIFKMTESGVSNVSS